MLFFEGILSLKIQENLRDSNEYNPLFLKENKWKSLKRFFSCRFFFLLELPVALMWRLPADLTFYSAVRLMPRFTWLLRIGTGFSIRKITAFPLGRGRKGKDRVGHIDNNIWSYILGQLFYSSSTLDYAATNKRQESSWSQARNTDIQGNYLWFHVNVQL